MYNSCNMLEGSTLEIMCVREKSAYWGSGERGLLCLLSQYDFPTFPGNRTFRGGHPVVYVLGSTGVILIPS